jgi:hypothetical protein
MKVKMLAVMVFSGFLGLSLAHALPSYQLVDDSMSNSQNMPSNIGSATDNDNGNANSNSNSNANSNGNNTDNSSSDSSNANDDMSVDTATGDDDY